MKDIKTTGATEDIIEIINDIEQLKTANPAKVQEICAKLEKLKEKVYEYIEVKDKVVEHNKLVREQNIKFVERFWGEPLSRRYKEKVERAGCRNTTRRSGR